MELKHRIAAWDAAFAAVRGVLRGEGLAEVSTPVRVAAVAVEPFIEPLPAGGGLLATSPELSMKRLLMRGVGPIFQIAHVARAAERGERHAEEFHLVEWYRPQQTDWARLAQDVETLVGAVFEAVGHRAPPARWQRHGLLDLVERTCGLRLTGDEDAEALRRKIAGQRDDLLPHVPDAVAADPDVAALATWTSFFSSWCDVCLDPWLQQQTDGIHVVEFPLALAALAAHGQPRVTAGDASALALRIESHAFGLELSNGYCELTDPAEQRRRFETVQGLRAAYGQPRLPDPHTFIDEMMDRGLPPAVGCALGLDRLVALACGRARLADVALPLDWSL